MDTIPMKIMLVDDDAAFLSHVRQILKRDPRLKVVYTAKDAYAAIAYAVQNPPDVILMDIEMESKLAGLYATREILRSVPECKVIIISKHSDDYHIHKAFQFGAMDYLTKPVDDLDLIDTILRVDKGNAVIHPVAAHSLRRKFAEFKNMQEHLSSIIDILLQLTPTELEILKMLHAGMRQQEISKVRFIEMTTMKTHISHILRKFNCHSVAELLEIVEEYSFFSILDEYK